VPRATRPGRLSEEELDTLFASLRDSTGIVAAVSGGPDSIALLDLLASWAAERGQTRILVATVDHGLRPEASEEAALVGRVTRGLGLPHRVLTWSGEKPRTGLQEAAREARYALLTELAREEGASHLVTAHTLDDQAETILMRLSRGSGPTGAVGMRRHVERDGILHVRPLLGWRKAALVAHCRGRGLPFVEDPSNRNPRFARSRWRMLLPQLEGEGLTPERLNAFAERIARAEEALGVKAREALEAARLGPSLYRGAAMAEEPSEIALRVLALALNEAVPSANHLRLNRLEACLEALRGALRQGRPLRRSIAGAVVSADASGNLALAPEPTRHRGRYPMGEVDAAAAPHSLEKGEPHA
jgi:tRNA(Ile)-lysidine synthase